MGQTDAQMSGEDAGVNHGGQDIQGSLLLARDAVTDLQRSVAACPLQHRRLARDMLDAATLANARIQDVSRPGWLHEEMAACVHVAMCAVLAQTLLDAAALANAPDCSAERTPPRIGLVHARHHCHTHRHPQTVVSSTSTAHGRVPGYCAPEYSQATSTPHPVPACMQAAVLRMVEAGVIVHAAFSLMQAARQAQLQVGAAGWA